MRSLNLKIDEKDAKELTQQLIQIPSVNPPGNVDKCAVFIKEWLNVNEIQAEIVKSKHVSNVVAKLGDESGKKLLWNGHFDVVPPGDNWNENPFSGIHKDGYVYGRGASDMKGGIAAMLLALRAFKKEKINLKGQIVFMGIGDEETGSENGTKMLLNKIGSNFDAALVSEPTDFYVERAQRGLRWIEVKISGKACHAGRPHIGKNAVEFAAKVIEAVKNIKFDVEHEVFEDKLKKPSLSVTMISGGIKTNIIPEECTLIIDRRMMPGETVEKITNEIKVAIDTVKEEGFSINLSLVNNGWDPYVVGESEDIVKSTIESYKYVMGENPKIRGKGGCTDASHIYKEGIPVVILGPGNANESHTANEKVSVYKVAKTAEIYIKTAIDFFSR